DGIRDLIVTGVQTCALPIFIALSGTYLSLARFGLLSTTQKAAKVDFDAIRSRPLKDPATFSVLKNTKLADVETIEFPFSEDAERSEERRVGKRCRCRVWRGE